MDILLGLFRRGLFSLWRGFPVSQKRLWKRELLLHREVAFSTGLDHQPSGRVEDLIEILVCHRGLLQSDDPFARFSQWTSERVLQTTSLLAEEL
jgi:hypothetical protein